MLHYDAEALYNVLFDVATPVVDEARASAAVLSGDALFLSGADRANAAASTTELQWEDTRRLFERIVDDSLDHRFKQM